MNPRRSTAVLRGLASLITAAVLLIGVPIALVTLVGWPLPTKVPDGDTLTRAVNTGLTDEFIVNTLAVVVWLCWAQLAFAFVAETVAAFKGRQPRDLPIASGLQVAAARLVAGIIMLAGPLQPARAIAAEPATPDPVVLVAEQAAPVIDLRTNTINGLPQRPAVSDHVHASSGSGDSNRRRRTTRHLLGDRRARTQRRPALARDPGPQRRPHHDRRPRPHRSRRNPRAGWTLDIPAEDPAPAPVRQQPPRLSSREATISGTCPKTASPSTSNANPPTPKSSPTGQM